MGKLLFIRLMTVLSLIPTFSQADVVLTLGGDVNFNRNLMPVNPVGVLFSSGTVAPWRSLTKDIAPLINGDLNFANIETVVSSTNNLSNQEKTFAFKSHPAGVKHLIDIGFNLFNLANNHTYDYGHEGMKQTLFEMKALKHSSPQINYAGLGKISEVFEPQVFTVNGLKIAFASATIGMPEFAARDDSPGILIVRDNASYRRLVANMARAQADFKILSIHFGTEGKVTLDDGQKKRYEYALEYGDVDLIVGHHPHVVRPVSQWKDRVIFYSMGNYLMLGSADITKKADTNLDWGLFSKLYLERDPHSGKVRIDAIEAIPLTNTHYRATPLRGAEARLRIEGLNRLSLQELGSNALQFRTSPNSGRGVYCGPQMNSIRAKILCTMP